MKRRSHRRGLSLPFSLMFLLVVIMLTMVLVTAASVTVSYVRRQRMEQQATLSVTSAAQMLASAIEESSVQTAAAADGSVTVVSVGTAGLSDLLKSYVGVGTASPITLTVSADGDNTALSAVEAKLTVHSSADADSPYDILVSLNLAGSTDADYRVSFRVNGAYDNLTGVYTWSGVTYYSGSEAY